MVIIRCSFLAIILFCAADVSAQENSICGKIEDEQLTIPSYKFIATDKNGSPFGNLRAEGKLDIEEGVWKGSWLEGHWETVHHSISIPIAYEPKEGVYISREVPKVRITRRRKGFPLSNECWDKVTRLAFSFNASNGDWGLFVFFFPNKKIGEISLPDAKGVIKVLMHDKKGRGVGISPQKPNKSLEMTPR